MRDADKGRGTFSYRKDGQMRKEYMAALNGYNNYFKEKIILPAMENFTITFVCTPYTYETNGSGILSAFSEDKKSGIAIGIKKKGIVTVKLGLGEEVVELRSLKEHLKFQESNIVTIAFWETAGWCDLYVNGILSNRKQFPRHSKIRLPFEECYIGKYVDGKEFKESTRRGVFHGRLDYIELTDGYQNYEQVVNYHKEHKQKAHKPINLYETQDFSKDIYRPVYHLMPPGKWMNEPHAPFYYRGWYHIFYQANPHAPVWDNLCWGHLVSRDMVKWKDAGIALYPDREGLDIDGCWSGSACMDLNGNPLLFYTAGNNQELPNQSVAVAHPENTEDLELKSWVKDGVVLHQSVGEGFLGEFRDPFVWRRGDTYYILVGTGAPDNGGGNALIYTSKDLKEFVCHGFLVDYDYEKCQESGHVWELPVLLPLRDETGEYVFDILLFCACQVEKNVVENYYFIGKYDYEKNHFHKFHELPGLIDLGNGTFTGPSGFVTADKRSVVFTIAQGKRNPEDEYHSGWAHNGGLPIELSIEKKELRITPIVELKNYFTHCVRTAEIKPEDADKAVLQMENISQNRILLSAPGDYLEMILEWKENSCIISYNRKRKEWIAVSGKDGKRISKIRNDGDLVDIGKEEIRMECYIDHSMIELYLNDKKSMTLRSYPFCEKNRFYVRTDKKCSVLVWEYGENAN